MIHCNGSGRVGVASGPKLDAIRDKLKRCSRWRQEVTDGTLRGLVPIELDITIPKRLVVLTVAGS
jgi:hypothetical protein